MKKMQPSRAAWLNEGELEKGGDILSVLMGGEIRPKAVDAPQDLVDRIKNEGVAETELN